MILQSIRMKGIPICVLAVLVVLFILLNGCAGSDRAQTPVSPPVYSNAAMNADSHYMLWGYWEGYIPSTHDSLELVPSRGTEIHVNARRMLEVYPCAHCLTLVSLNIDQVAGIMEAEIQLRHPFPGLDRYTGFDVRGVVITDGSRYFPALDATVPDWTLGDFTLTNPDGYTRLWNTLEFPEGSGAFSILEYSQGNLASPGDFTGTVNPFISYGQDPRNHFPAGKAMTKTFKLKLPPGAIRFGYAIDASWAIPTVDPPKNIPFDFPMSANAHEPIFESWDISTALYDFTGSEGTGEAYLFDRQGWQTVQSAFLECPDVWSGAIEAGAINYVDSTSDGDLLVAEFTYSNEYGTQAGNYPGLLKVVDSIHDYWLGDVNHTYSVISITVEDSQQPDIIGEIVFMAPGQPDSTGHCNPNVFHLDLETMIETQLTFIMGIGMSVSGPQINPAGTHMLCPTGPSGYYTWLAISEIGIGSCGQTSGPYDCSGCFHPDGEHILSTSADEIFNQPLFLYSWKYDGTEPNLIATADDTIRHPCWCPDESRIVFTKGQPWGPSYSSEICIYDLATEEFTEIMTAPGIDDYPSFSPVQVGDSYLIAFESTRDHYPEFERDIYVVNPDTEEILCHLDTGVSETHPSFSPDGLSFIFSMTPEGQDDSELFVYFWQTDVMVQITDDDSYDTSPSWSWNW